jgi:hypothetical protein
VAQQRPQQHRDDAQKQQIGQPEQQRRPAGTEGHADALDNPRRRQPDQRGPVPATHLHPVFGGGEQEAAEHGPAEAEEHLVGVPLERAHRARRGRQLAGEHQRPQQRKGQPGQAGEQEKRAEADEPEGMGRQFHGQSDEVAQGQRWRKPTPSGLPEP